MSYFELGETGFEVYDLGENKAFFHDPLAEEASCHFCNIELYTDFYARFTIRWR